MCCLAVGGVAGAQWEFRGWGRVVQCGRLDKFLVKLYIRMTVYL